MAYKDKDKQRWFQTNWYSIKKRIWIERMGACVFCGSLDNIQIHHLDPKDKWSHRIWSYTDDVIELELAKCIALCKHCHNMFHGLLRRKKVSHGTTGGYRIGCRCRACKDANNRSEIERRRGIIEKKAGGLKSSP